MQIRHLAGGVLALAALGAFGRFLSQDQTPAAVPIASLAAGSNDTRFTGTAAPVAAAPAAEAPAADAPAVAAPSDDEHAEAAENASLGEAAGRRAHPAIGTQADAAGKTAASEPDAHTRRHRRRGHRSHKHRMRRHHSHKARRRKRRITSRTDERPAAERSSPEPKTSCRGTCVSRGDAPAASGARGSVAAASGGDVNEAGRSRFDPETADAAAWSTIPGVDAVLAARIVRMRDAGGGFDDLDDLLDVDGVTPALLRKIRLAAR